MANLTGCASLQNFGNSLAFWKKSPPKDNYITSSPSSNFSPTAISDDQNRGSGNSGSPGGTTSPYSMSQHGFSSNQNQSRPRTPYNTELNNRNPALADRSTNSFSTGQPAARTASAGSRMNFNGGPGPNTLGASTAAGTQNRFQTSNPASTSGSRYQPTSSGFNSTQGSFVPNGSTGTSNSPATYIAPQNYSPSTNKGGFGNPANSPTQPSSASPGSTNSNSSNGGNYPTTPYPSFSEATSSKSYNIQPASHSEETPASRSLSVPPSLPDSVFPKKGDYSPGSTAVQGKATQADFQSNGSPSSVPSASKIPSMSSSFKPATH